MARLTDLVATMAQATGQREQSISQLARHLREAGLITQGGRGRGAAHMTPRDATNLLLGVLASDQWQDAPERVTHAREAQFTGWERNYDGAARDDLPPVPFMFCDGRMRSFGDALDAMFAEMVADEGPAYANGLGILNLDVVVTRPGLRSTIEIRGEPTVFAHFHRNDPRFDGVPRDEWNALARSLYPLEPHLTITATVGYAVLWPLAECIAK